MASAKHEQDSKVRGAVETREDTIDFDDNDAEDPLNWSSSRKVTIVLLVVLLSASTQLATIIAAPVAPQIQRDLNSPSDTLATLLVTIWELGEVVAPLFFGPLSEEFGRAPVMNVSNLAFVACSVGCALSGSVHVLIAMRFLNGMSVAVISLGGGIVGDLLVKEKRGLALSLMMIGAQTGPALGPIVGSYLGEAAGWRWAFWLTTILNGTFGLVFAVCYRETYRVKILERKVAVQRKITGNANLRSKYHEGQPRSRWIIFRRKVLRPAWLLVRSWALAGVTLYVSIMLGLFYLSLTSIAPLFQRLYGFSEGQSGLAYLGLYTGMMLGCLYFNVASHLASSKSTNSSDTAPLQPEHRLIPSTAAGLLISAGLFIFGWTLAYHTHWIAPIIGSGLVGLGWFVTTASVRAYIIDAFGIYAVSASAAMFAVRNVAGALLPLVGPSIYANLGYGWGASVLAFVALAVVPLPLLLVRLGARLRKRSRLDILE